MSRSAGIVLALLVGVGLGVWADCGCGVGPDSNCVATFRAHEIIEFSLTVPIEYYWCHDTTATPLVNGWWIEDEDGALVAQAQFSEPLGHNAEFEWDPAAGGVTSGTYRILISATTGEVAETWVTIVDPCAECGCWSCWNCVPSPKTWTAYCPAECGGPYVMLRSGGLASCCGFSFVVTFDVGCGCP
jgi:hypothetical protein